MAPLPGLEASRLAADFRRFLDEMEKNPSPASNQ